MQLADRNQMPGAAPVESESVVIYRVSAFSASYSVFMTLEVYTWDAKHSRCGAPKLD